uniref:Leucine-rich repeat-containing N-terminal plant-type domain-containing protein n=1 Tax=Kalanchoe fedtschenkoi TaxID=63787 RepID=A0A7N0TSP3_KALFE
MAKCSIFDSPQLGCRNNFVAFCVVVVQSLMLSSMAIMDPVDFLALQSIRNSLTDLPGSDFFSSWDFTAEPCDFAGVLCDGDKVVALNLGDPRAGSPGLSGRLHPALGQLSSLVEFSLVPGRVMGSLPSTLSDCNNLRFLALSRNFLSGAIPPSFGRLRSLQTLDLSYNVLTGEIPASIGTIPTLTNLILCHNRLSGAVPVFTSQTLSRFSLNHNRLNGTISPYSLPPSIQYLSLSWNRFSGQVDALLSRLDQLNYVDLSMNLFTGLIPAKIFTLPISSLQLQRNAFSCQILPENQVAISTVDLSYNRFYGQISPMFSSVPNLYLNNNKFSGRVPANFVQGLLASSIQILYLQHNYLTGIEINPTAEIPTSSSLCLQYNCMVPPVQNSCPNKAGKQKTRPTTQCVEWQKKLTLGILNSDDDAADSDHP